MRSEAYLSEIRQSAGLKRAVLRKISVEGNTVTFFLVTDLTYGKEDIEAARAVSRNYVPEGCTAQVSILKSVASAEAVAAAILELIRTRFPAAAAFISPGDVSVETNGTGGRFLLAVDEEVRSRFAQGDVLNAAAAALMRQFCGVWTGDYRSAEKEKELEHEALPEAETVAAPRTFPIGDYAPIDGAAPEYALYIADLAGEQPNVTVCGTVTHIEERLTKKEKPFFRLTVDDGTGRLAASYFSKKATLEKVRAVKAGDSVCLTGANEFFGGAYRFTARQLDYGAPPEGFTPKARPSRPVPARYVKVVPEPLSDLVQADLFGGTPLPAAFVNGKFVVFDLETTGLSYSGSTIDHIIEVGAVKIEHGQISEKFSSFVACPVKVSAEITRLTGIDDDMLAGAPETKDVIADFYKFCDGCALVAQNISFDSSFIRYYGEKEGYLFDHRQYDTLTMAQSALLLPNYKLNTIADHFGFTFRHHRAFDDAFVTAKIFMELVRMKGALPK